jgi:RNA polymerase sigma-70 factor (ECF subfamily)
MVKRDMKNLSDFEIIESIKRGNAGDYALLVNRYKDKAFSMLRRMLKNDMDAEEALQDSFLKAFKSLDNFRSDAKFATWFYRIVYNTALSVLSSKRKKDEKNLVSMEDELNLSAGEEKIYAESGNVSEFINKLIEELPPKYSAVLNMFYMDGMTHDEISQATGFSLVNIKIILHRSRNALRDVIIKRNYQEDLI